jgi:hypothetical protein
MSQVIMSEYGQGASPKYSREQLEAMDARELEAAVAEVVFGLPVNREHWTVPQQDGTPLILNRYASTWHGFGAILKRMQELGFSQTLGDQYALFYHRSFNPCCKDSKSAHGNAWNKDIKCAAAIAAVLAAQEAA